MPNQDAEELVGLIRSSAPWPAVARASRTLIESLLKQAEPLGATLHPYGFLILRASRADAETVRIHIWPVGPRSRQVPDWPVHSHPWKLRSYVLAGTAVNEVYEVESEAGGAGRLYRVGYDDPYSVISMTPRRVRCEISSRDTHVAPAFYEVHQSAFHATHVPEDVFAATVVLTWLGRKEPAHVVGDAEARQEYRFLREAAPEEQARRLLSDLLSRIAAA